MGRRHDNAGLEAAKREILSAEPALGSVREQMLAFVDEHSDALLRSCLVGHLTGSALVMDDASGKVLLLHHAKLQRWLQPGGHADGEGDLGAVALREATEETGLQGLELMRPAIDLDIHVIPARGSEPEHLHLDVRYLVLAPLGSAVVINAVVTNAVVINAVVINTESTASRWIDPLAERHLLGTDELRRLVDAGLARRRRG